MKNDIGNNHVLAILFFVAGVVLTATAFTAEGCSQADNEKDKIVETAKYNAEIANYNAQAAIASAKFKAMAECSKTNSLLECKELFK